jgi:hypothetical protein
MSAFLEGLAKRVAEAERVSRYEAREAVAAAADVLEWRYDYPPPPGRVMHLARLMLHPPPPPPEARR